MQIVLALRTGIWNAKIVDSVGIYKLREYLEKKGRGSQGALAFKTGYTKQQISDIVKKRRKPTLEQVVAIYHVIGIRPEEWCEGYEFTQDESTDDRIDE